MKSFVAIVELSLKSLVVLLTESLESSATSIVVSLRSLLTPVVVSEPLLTVAISLVLRSSDALTAVSFASWLTLVTVRSPLLETSTPPSTADWLASLASLLIEVTPSFMSLNISPKLKSADKLVVSARAATVLITNFFVIYFPCVLI